jgi:3-dehydroquinate synthase
VESSVILKCAVVDEDPEEVTGRRNILNAGHTVGHALERLSDYRLSHGEAVASGLLWEAAASVAQGHLEGRELAVIRGAVEGLGFPPAWRGASPEEVFAAAGADKKNRAGKVAYVPLGTVGAPAVAPPHTAPLTEEALAAGLRLIGGM